MEEGSKGEGTREGSEREGGKRGREADEQDLQAEQQQEGEGDGRPRRKRARGVRYGEEQQGCEEQGAVQEGMTVYGPHKVSGKWRRYVGTVKEMIEQQDRKGHVTRAAIVQWEDQGGGMRRDCRTRWKGCRYAREVGRWKYTTFGSGAGGKRIGRRRGVGGGEEQEEEVTINEAGGGREEGERSQTKTGGKEQKGGQRHDGQRGSTSGWGGQVATHEVVHS